MHLRKSVKPYIKIIFCLHIFVFSYSVKAQIPSWKWGRGVNAQPGYIEGFGISVDANSNAYAVGYSEPNCNPYFGGGDTLHGTVSPFIVKYDSNGNTIWAKTIVGIPTNGLEIYWADAVDKHGNIYVAGTSNSQKIVAGGDTLIVDGLEPGVPDSFRRKIFIVKYDPLGNVIWCKTLRHLSGPNPTQLEEDGFKITADVNEGFAITGYLNCNDPSYYWIFGNDTIQVTSYGNTCFVAKFDSAGNALWAQPYGGLGIAEDPVGNIFVTADWRSLTTYQVIGNDTLYGRRQVLTDTGYYVSYITKINPTGTILKAVNCGAIYSSNGNTAGFVRGLSADKRGNIYIASDWSDTLFISTDTLIGSIDSAVYPSFFIAKYDNALNYKWARADTSVGVGYVNVVACDTMDGVYLGGLFKPFNSVSYATEVSPVIKFDSNGNHIWSKQGYAVINQAMSLDRSGNIYTTGICVDGFPCNFDGDTVTSSAGSLYFNGYYAAKLATDHTLSVDDHVLNDSQLISVYPNPAESYFNLKVDEALIGATYVILDMVGKEILSDKIVSDITTISFNSVSPGVYFIKINSKNGLQVKIVKI